VADPGGGDAGMHPPPPTSPTKTELSQLVQAAGRALDINILVSASALANDTCSVGSIAAQLNAELMICGVVERC